MPRKLIMCGDHPVLAFEYEPASGRACSSGEVLDPRRLPLEFTTHGKSALYARRIDEWWKSRAIPSTRDGIRRVLDSLGASSTGELLDRTYGLSLSDQYWVKREDDPVEWKDVNFFDNPFDEALGEILLTSMDRDGTRQGFDIPLTKQLSLNFDVKKVYIKTDVYSGDVKVGTFKVDPVLVGVGLGYRF